MNIWIIISCIIVGLLAFGFYDSIRRERELRKKLIAAFGAPVKDKMYAESGSRSVNLDPGLLSLENFILATGKNYSHRIYLRDGVFAEVTLIFGKKGVIRELPWSYRDYLLEPARSFLLTVRELYRKKREHLLGKGAL